VPGRSEAARRAGDRARPHDLGPIVEALAGHASALLVTKRTWGAFHGTDLDLRPRRRGVTQMVLGGVPRLPGGPAQAVAFAGRSASPSSRQ
jgi:Isochorismatase family